MNIFDCDTANFCVFFDVFKRKVLSLQKIYKYITLGYDS
jgi:hypothetical protein